MCGAGKGGLCPEGVFSDTESLQTLPSAVEISCFLSLGVYNLELSSVFVWFGFSGNCIFEEHRPGVF